MHETHSKSLSGEFEVIYREFYFPNKAAKTIELYHIKAFLRMQNMRFQTI